MTRRRIFAYGGVAASLILIAFGVACIVIVIQGRSEVRDRLAQENIVGTPDSAIPGELVDTGGKAQAFADVMREHALAASGGLTYAELDRFIAPDGTTTNDPSEAAVDEFGNTVTNPQRELWINATALSTALEMAAFAEQVGIFAIVMGVALLLTGIGFGVLTTAELIQPALITGRGKDGLG